MARVIMTATERFEAKLRVITERAKINSWGEFVRSLNVPIEIAPAIMANRPSLVGLAVPRAMDADEVGTLFKLIQGLLETNQALQEHASEVSDLAAQATSIFTGLSRVLVRLAQFAAFEHQEMVTTEDDED